MKYKSGFCAEVILCVCVCGIEDVSKTFSVDDSIWRIGRKMTMLPWSAAGMVCHFFCGLPFFIFFHEERRHI
jgi:hypothetical protein